MTSPSDQYYPENSTSCASSGIKICHRETCAYVGNPQPRTNFSSDRARKDGLSPTCKSCVKAYNQIRKNDLALLVAKARDKSGPITEKICQSEECSSLGTPQPVRNFSSNILKIDGFDIYCKACCRIQRQIAKKKVAEKVSSGMFFGLDQRCSRCDKSQPLEGFYKNLSRPNGRDSVCIECRIGHPKGRIKRPQSSADIGKSHKVCTRCKGEPQPMDNFCRDKSSPDGRAYRCKICSSEIAALLKNSRPEKVKEYAAKSHAKNKEGRWAKRAIYGCRIRAKKKTVPFNIDISDLMDINTGELPKFCSVFLFIKLDYNSGPDRRLWASVDRIIPQLGYVKGNVRVISMTANFAKMDGIGDLVQYPISPPSPS